MKNWITILTLSGLCLALAGCDERAHQTDSGGVLLVTEISGSFPFRVSVNENDSLQLESLTIRSVIPDGSTASELATVEINAMEVTFTRADGGSVVPPPLVRNLLAVVGAGGTADLTLTVMTSEQMRNPPLSDLLFINGGFDKETGKTNIKLNVHLRFFGETLGGREVQTEPRSLTIEFVQ